MNFSIGNREFSFRRLSAFEQCDLSRKVAPFLPLIVPAMQSLTAERDVLDSTDIIALVVEKTHPLLAALGALEDKDFYSIMRLALRSIEMRDASREFHPLMNGDSLMRDDLPYELLLILTVKSCVENLRPTTPLADIMGLFSV